MIIKMLTVAPIGTNCYIAGCESTKECIIIDPKGEPEKILGAIEEQQFTLKFMINTHAHFDHIGAASSIQQQKQVPFLLHKEEAVYLDPGVFTQTLASFGITNVNPPKVDEYIDPDKIYKFGDYQFTVLETPGHSPGGVCFLFENEVFVGDTLFAGSIGRTDFPGGSMETLMHSIKTKLMPLDDKTVVYAGHMHPTTIGQEREFNPFKEYWT